MADAAGSDEPGGHHTHEANTELLMVALPRQLATSSMPIMYRTTGSFRLSSSEEEAASELRAAAEKDEPNSSAQDVTAESSVSPCARTPAASDAVPGDEFANFKLLSPRTRANAHQDDATQGMTPTSSHRWQPGGPGTHTPRPLNTHSLSGVGGSFKAVEPVQGILAYIYAETSAAETMPTSDVVWGQTERDTVYNFLLYVPYHLETLMHFSLLLCLDVFLGAITLLPLRCLLACAACIRTLRQPASSRGKLPASLGGGRVFDIVCLFILLATTVVLRTIRPAYIYFWLRDATNEFLKLSVLVAALEIADKILGDFGLKVLQALQGTCTLWCMGEMSLRHLVCDAFVALVIVLIHALTIMCQALILSIAINSSRHGLLALLIGSNFLELKGAVFKRWDTDRIKWLAWMDFVERFQLVATLLFVVVEDMGSSSSFQPNVALMRELGRILGAEMLIDVLKHAVISKFNDQRPGIYREYMKDLCDKVVVSQSHSLHTLLRFPHLASAALFLRSVVTLFWLKLDVNAGMWLVCVRAAVFGCMWLGMVGIKVALGFGLKSLAHSYAQKHHQLSRGSARPFHHKVA